MYVIKVNITPLTCISLLNVIKGNRCRFCAVCLLPPALPNASHFAYGAHDSYIPNYVQFIGDYKYVCTATSFPKTVHAALGLRPLGQRNVQCKGVVWPLPVQRGPSGQRREREAARGLCHTPYGVQRPLWRSCSPAPAKLSNARDSNARICGQPQVRFVHTDSWAIAPAVPSHPNPRVL